jgi:hypothetical protein
MSSNDGEFEDSTGPYDGPSAADFVWANDVEEEVAAGAVNIRGLDWVIQDVLELDEDEDADDPQMTPLERERYLREWVLVKGLLWHASNTIIDGLFDDITLLGEEPDGSGWRKTQYLLDLPPRYGHLYNLLFGRMFLVAMVDVTAAVAADWDEPQSVAHELATHLLLTEVRTVQETLEIDLEAGLIEHLEDVMFEDRDFDLLYSRRMDGIEAYSGEDQFGLVNIDFGSWFVPFAGVRPPAPYATNPLDLSDR